MHPGWMLLLPQQKKASMRAASANTKVVDLLAHWWQEPAADNTNRMLQFMILMNQQRWQNRCSCRHRRAFLLCHHR